jgi:hypothetical protein
MKKTLCLTFFVLITCSFTFAQEGTSPVPRAWEFSTELNFYFFSDDFITLPVIKADKNWLHLEARYNYEDLNTFSGWVGYNFIGGNDFEYSLTPMVGGVVGESNGVAPGFEATLTYKGFELYTESELFIDLEYDNDFVYAWTDISYSPKDWLWFGISGQRTRLYESGLDIQRGLLVGGGYKSIELTTYFYNPGSDDTFILLALAASF